ncbi:MAG: hypothetical protein Q9222_007941, partial [Ikaeria aurantiellina]
MYAPRLRLMESLNRRLTPLEDLDPLGLVSDTREEISHLKKKLAKGDPYLAHVLSNNTPDTNTVSSTTAKEKKTTRHEAASTGQQQRKPLSSSAVEESVIRQIDGAADNPFPTNDPAPSAKSNLRRGERSKWSLLSRRHSRRLRKPTPPPPSPNRELKPMRTLSPRPSISSFPSLPDEQSGRVKRRLSKPHRRARSGMQNGNAVDAEEVATRRKIAEDEWKDEPYVHPDHKMPLYDDEPNHTPHSPSTVLKQQSTTRRERETLPTVERERGYPTQPHGSSGQGTTSKTGGE